MIGLGLDGGGTGSRWRLTDGHGEILGEGTAGPLTGHVFDDVAKASTQAALAELAETIIAVGKPDRIVAGVTGLSTGSEIALLLALWLAREFGLAVEAVQVVDDMRIAYRSAFRPGEGILVYAGTGSVAFHLAEDGTASRAGGHGYLIDDAGGGYWIGRQALRSVLRAHDEGRDTGALGHEVAAVTGGLDWELVRRHVYGGGRAAVAALVPAVARAAARDDDVASTILSSAGEELARLARVMLTRLGSAQPVALAGGVSRASPMVFAHFRTSLPRHTVLRLIDRPPVEAAARLAAEGIQA